MDIAVLTVAIIVVAIVVFRYRQIKKNTDRPDVLPESSDETYLKTALYVRTSDSHVGSTTVAVSSVSKSFSGTLAVNDVSFELKSGQILGLVGPNGAGKTTVIRMLMNIIAADSGSIKILDDLPGVEIAERIGYLPEERGLYRKISVIETLEYMGRLKGMSSKGAKKASEKWLQSLGMSEHKTKKIEQLSKGMGQIVQLAATIIHDPELVILDEPFSGLDPVNREMLKRIILELKKAGRTIMLSTHQMNEVEELCDRVLMINRGKVVLYGGLQEIRTQYRNNSIFLECSGSIADLPGVDQVKDHGRYAELFVKEGTAANQVLSSLVERGVVVERFEVSTPSLHDIFIQVAKETP